MFEVSRNCFVPAPNVDSVVISLRPKKNKYLVSDVDLFFQLVRDSFQFKRKNIKNNLRKYNLEVVEKVLKKYGFDLNVRAEDLSYEVFVDLANSLI